VITTQLLPWSLFFLIVCVLSDVTHGTLSNKYSTYGYLTVAAGAALVHVCVFGVRTNRLGTVLGSALVTVALQVYMCAGVCVCVCRCVCRCVCVHL